MQEIVEFVRARLAEISREGADDEALTAHARTLVAQVSTRIGHLVASAGISEAREPGSATWPSEPRPDPPSPSEFQMWLHQTGLEATTPNGWAELKAQFEAYQARHGAGPSDLP